MSVESVVTDPPTRSWRVTRARLASVDWAEILTAVMCVAVVFKGPMFGLVLLGSGLIAGGLERLRPFRNQRVIAGPWRTDVYHALLSSAVAASLAAVVITTLGSALRTALVPVAGALGRQPLVLQIVEAMLIADLATYTLHRFEHSVPWLWRFHQVHHSVENLNWLASYRVHPVDKALNGIVAVMPIYVLGLWSWPVFVLVDSIIDAVNTPWAHGNLNISLGRFWWLVRNPEFHRWHHARSRTAMNSNFSQVFPIWDIIFRTTYMPRDKKPEAFGLPDPLPTGYIDQVMLPFMPKAPPRAVTDGSAAG